MDTTMPEVNDEKVCPEIQDDNLHTDNQPLINKVEQEDSNDIHIRPQSMKREKSQSDSVEREKKRVKFNTNHIEYSNDRRNNKGRDKNGLSKPTKYKEKGILKNKGLHIALKCVDKIPTCQPSIDCLSNKERREESLLNYNANLSSSEAVNDESITVSRQSTFTKEESPLGSSQLQEIHSGHNKIETKDKYPISKSMTNKQHQKDNSSSAKTMENDKDTKKINVPFGRRRNNIVPKESKCHPQIINVKDRKIPLCLKRNLGKDKETIEVPSDAQEKVSSRKCLKLSSEGPPKKNVKEALSSNSKRNSSNPGKTFVLSNESRELKRVYEENRILKDQNKNLEGKLKEQNSRERDLTNQQRTMKEQYEIETSKIMRESKREAAILLSELKSKERVVANLEKALQKHLAEKTTKISPNSETDAPTKNYSIPRPTLTRSVSAAAAIGRKAKPQINRFNKALKKDEISRSLATRKRNEIVGKGNGTEKRYISKLEQMRKQLEDQHREIIALNQRLKNQSPNLKSLSQLSASVPTIYEGEKNDQVSRSTSKGYCGIHDTRNESFTPNVSTLSQPCLPDECQIRSKGIDFETSMMANLDEIRSKSLDLFGNKLSSLEPPSSLRYSSLMSLNGTRRETELAEENEMLRAELQETRDHAELLEFRILEFTEGIQKATSVVHSTCDQSTNTSADDITTPPPISEDLSLPLSVDSGLELNIDINKSRLSDYRKSLTRLEEAAGLSESSSVTHLSSLLDWVYLISGGQYENLQPTMSPRSPIQKKMGVSTGLEEHRFDDNLCGAELTMLAAKLQETLTNPKAQEEVLEETIIKLRLVSTSLSRLQSRVNSLTLENKELQEALTALHESQETRTEASGTESELVNGKTPSLHSDLSDSESDDSPRPAKTTNMETAASFQESGIFETSCEMINSSTQTSQTHEMTDFTKDSAIREDSSTDQHSLSGDSEKSLGDENDNEKPEVDLQTALARLTSIKNVVQGRDLHNLRLQDLQENDEYLVAALEGEKVTLCKIEYDTIVATERSLQREIEILQYEKEQLALQYASLEGKIRKQKRDDEWEVLRAEVRLLEERLQISDRYKREYFDEKCEMEEAENDARLLAQRLESQLEAAREMESLLSASLSQEQEFCRELQRKVREMHEIDKGRRMHEEVLEKESQFCRRREEALMVVNDRQKSQLTFALYGLILAQFWRRIASHNKDAIVPFTSLEDSAFIIDVSQFSSETPMLPSFPCVTECDQCLSRNYEPMKCVNLNDAWTQTSAANKYEKHETANVEEIYGESTRNKHMSTERITLSENEDLSDREEFYLSQIESLQKERKSLREDYENERSLLIQQLQTMKTDLERIEQSLEESQRDKCKLLFKFEEAQAMIRGSEIEIENQAKELKREFSQSVEVYQQEQKAMQDQYEERIGEMRRNIEFHEQRFAALLQQYSILQHELEPYFQSVSDNVDDEYASEEGCSGRILTTKDLLSAVRELVRSESSAKQKLNDLEKKESAYRETINEADRIMSNHVTIYTRRIEELEAALEQKSLRIKQLETSEERLRTTMKSSWKSGEGARITELLDRLIETENSELNLKERVWNLERNGKELQIKFAEAEKAQENLRSELRDQEELVQRLMTLTSENNALTSELQEAHEAARRASDIQQSENYLKSRVDELEASENGLRDALKQTEQIMMQRERKYRDQMSNLEEEISTLRGQLEIRITEAKQGKEVEASLRHQIDNYKGQIHNLEKELKDSSSENICHETQHRSEVTKLRSQLKLANSQLTDLDTLNGELKERLTAAESAMKEVAVQLEERARRHESDVLSLNLQLNQKDSKLEEFEVQFQQISHADVAGEFDYLATSPLVHLQKSIDNFIKNSKNCKECSKNKNNHLETLNDCLKTLNELINGRNSQCDSESEDYESPQAENLADETLLTTFPPNPAQEGFNDTSSGDGETSSVYSLPLASESATEGDQPSPKALPSAPPRPRRDAKKKRKIRKSVKNEGSLLDELEESSVEKGSFYGKCPPSITILDELEEKVRELEEVVARKDEELRLADGEAADLHSRLMKEDGKLLQKTEEASKSNEALLSLRQQLLMTVQEYESVRQALEAKHQVNMSELTKKVENLTEDLLRLSQKSHLKDNIIGSLVKQIRCILRSGSKTVLVNNIRKISEDSTENEIQNNGDDLKISDFDVDTVCNLLEQPDEVSAEPEATHATQLDALSCQSLPSFSSLDSAKVVKKSRSASETESSKGIIGVPSKACLATRNLPPLEQTKKSRIPRFRPLSSPPLKHDDCPLQEFAPKPLNKQNKNVCSEVPMKPSEAKQELKPLAKVVPKQRPMAKVTPKPKTTLGEDSSNRFLTDARKIKRMVTGLAPINASVDCSSAPEYKKQLKPPTPSCVPRPKDLRITRRVGIDGAVIAWKPLEHDCVAGFQVIVGGRVVQQVRSPHRTKALVTGLPFPSPFTIALVAITEDGRCSTPTLVSHENSNAYKPKLQQHRNSSSVTSPSVTPRRAVPTCL